MRHLARCFKRARLWMAILMSIYAMFIVFLGIFYAQDKLITPKESLDRVDSFQETDIFEINKDESDVAQLQIKNNLTREDSSGVSSDKVPIPEGKLEKEVKNISQLGRWKNLPIELPQVAPGEFGVKFNIRRENLTSEEQAEWDEGYNYAGYNVFVSDRIALRRRVPDYRGDVCRNLSYPDNLPQASVIIPFHKEALSALMRTVYSVLDRAPPRLLKEVILIDDFSESEDFLEPLDAHIAKFSKVKILRNAQREGLMKSRMRGVYAATAPVVVIKDAHTEYMEGWLEPLLDAIARDKKTIALSHIHMLSIDDFSLNGAGKPTRHSFGIHAFDFRLFPGSPSMDQNLFLSRTSEADPIVSPAMMGSEFAVDKEFFLHLGGYDPGMEVWGAEEMELSFKTWMCGGSIKRIPCSRVWHLFRLANHRNLPGKYNTHVRNKLRVAQVWMDEYRDLVYQVIGPAVGTVSIGNLTDQINLRKRLKCNSFDWYLRNVAYMVYAPRNLIAQGEIHNVGQPSCCLSSFFRPRYDRRAINSCGCAGEFPGDREFWMMTESGQIRKDVGCISYKNTEDKVLYTACRDPDKGKNQLWKLTTSKNIVLVSSGKCLELKPDRTEVILKECIQGRKLQEWTIVPRPGAPTIS